MKKNILSKFLMLALVVGVFGLVAATRVLAQEGRTTTTNINNQVPAFAGEASDNMSEGTSPTNVGANVTFTATATDPNDDDFYLAICKTDAVTAGSGGAPTCPGGYWAISAATASGAQATTTYTTTGTEAVTAGCPASASGDVESCDWYAFVCDGNGTPGLCSSKSLTGASPSPFKINHAGTFGTVGVTNTSGTAIVPGNTLRFTLPNAQIDDTDNDTTQDTLTMHICTAATTDYNYSDNICNGGATICNSSAVNPTTTDATCDGGASLVTVPTAHASYDFKVYVEDGHDFAATGTNTQQYVVTDVDPVITSWTTTDYIDGTHAQPGIAAGGSQVMDYAVALSDDNGDQDVTNVEGRFFDATATTNVCASNEKNCYIQASCTLSNVSGASTGKTAMGTDKDLDATCAATVWFNANAGTNWEFHVNPTDSAVVKTGLADTNVNKEVLALTAIGVTQSAIVYGTIAVGGDSLYDAVAPDTNITSLENQGNQILDVLVSGTDMSDGSHTIPVAQQKFSETNADFTWSSAGVVLVTSGSLGTDEAHGCLNRNLAIRAVHGTGTEDETLAWKIRIPATQESGAYTGMNTFATATELTCSDGPF
jgi:hypothetical protein